MMKFILLLCLIAIVHSRIDKKESEVNIEQVLEQLLDGNDETDAANNGHDDNNDDEFELDDEDLVDANDNEDEMKKIDVQKDPLWFRRAWRSATRWTRGAVRTVGRAFRRTITNIRKFRFRFRRVRIAPPVAPLSCSRKTYGKCSVRQKGCGGGKFAKLSSNTLPFGRVFRKACNKHDNCYNCGKSRGWSQNRCDVQMHSDMKNTCRCKYNSALQKAALGTCLGYAQTYYGLVLVSGNKFYEKTSLSYCTNDCVIERSSPNTGL